MIKYCAVGRQLGYAGYLSLDAITFLDAANIRKSPNTKRLQQEAYRCWMIGLLFSAVSGAYSLYSLRQQQARIDKKDGEGAIATKRIEKYVFSCVERSTANELIQGARGYQSPIYLRSLRSCGAHGSPRNHELR